jgi:hypothetical protein
MDPRGSGASARQGALRAIDSFRRSRSWRTCGPRRLRRQSQRDLVTTYRGACASRLDSKAVAEASMPSSGSASHRRHSGADEWTVVFPHFSGVALLDSVPLNLRGEWRGTTRIPTRVPPEGLGPGRGRPADRRGRPGAGHQRPVDLHLAPPRPHRPRLEPGLSSGEKAELVVAKRRIAELETELHAMRRAMELVREVVPQKAVPGRRGDGRRAHPGRGRLPGPGRVDLGLLRLAVTAAVGEVDPSRLAHRPDRPGPPALPWRLRRLAGVCRAAPRPRDRGRPQRRCPADAPRWPRRGHRPAQVAPCQA